ncbi:MAG: OsmC family protein [Sphingomonadales bacterium]|jgi:uncharacterized OsmC-like protein
MLDTMTKTPNCVNGIDLNALGQMVEEIKADATKAQVEFNVTNVWKGQTKGEAQVKSYRIGGKEVTREFNIAIDEPVELLGNNAHANPQEYLMAALNACMMVGYVANAALRGITLEALEIETNGTLDLRGFLGLNDDIPAGYEKLFYKVRIKGDGTAAEFEEIHKAVQATSPNYFNLARPIPLESELEVLG